MTKKIKTLDSLNQECLSEYDRLRRESKIEPVVASTYVACHMGDEKKRKSSTKKARKIHEDMQNHRLNREERKRVDSWGGMISMFGEGDMATPEEKGNCMLGKDVNNHYYEASLDKQGQRRIKEIRAEITPSLLSRLKIQERFRDIAHKNEGGNGYGFKIYIDNLQEEFASEIESTGELPNPETVNLDQYYDSIIEQTYFCKSSKWKTRMAGRELEKRLSEFLGFTQLPFSARSRDCKVNGALCGTYTINVDKARKILIATKTDPKDVEWYDFLDIPETLVPYIGEVLEDSLEYSEKLDSYQWMRENVPVNSPKARKGTAHTCKKVVELYDSIQKFKKESGDGNNPIMRNFWNTRVKEIETATDVKYVAEK